MDNKEFLISKISRNSQVVQELEGSAAWKIIKEDFEKERDRIDNTWHMVPEERKNDLTELRVAKMAITQILNMPENYRHDLVKAQEQLSKEAISQEFANSENYGDETA